MTKEQREQAEDWAVSLAAVLHGVAGEEVAALLRAGIAASEELAALRAERGLRTGRKGSQGKENQ